ncbi:5374_t:CDS:2 [Dentiscutata erythropus]|uniref:5374_t:CDS:1 n=1 Tax=Dentiscutata erythropus TaxID=1348616 RepID=A0A9N9DTA9_9GLOM|nr:5374_t:CDS:2 [Dentiscutata erythropus]
MQHLKAFISSPNINNLDSLYTLEGIYNQSGNYEGYIECATKILEIQPDDTRILMNRGIFHMNAGNQQYLEKAIELNSDEPYWYCQLGALFIELQQYDEALKKLNAAIEKYKPDCELEFDELSEALDYKASLYSKITGKNNAAELNL